MANNKRGEAVPDEDHKAATIGTLKMMVTAGTDEINKTHKRKFDEITEKLEVMEESVAKILKTNEDEKNVRQNQYIKGLESEKRFVLKHVFKNVDGFEIDQPYFTEIEVHSNIKWYARLKRNDERRLQFHIYCNPIAAVEDEFSVEVKLKYTMMANDNIITKALKHCFDEREGVGINKFLDWEQIEHYLVDNTLSIEVEVEILKMTGFEKKKIRLFDESKIEFSDVILEVQDTKFYVGKKFLALQSSYFKSLFIENHDESQKTEFKLKDIEAGDFQNFLELIHGESSVDDGTVSALLHLADMYAAPTATRRCEEFLSRESHKSLVQQLQLALRYNLENLKSECISDVKEISDIEAIMAANLPEMDLSTSQALLEKSIELYNA
ncbi:unnamed protein product [Caenorhabditis nigoni]